MSVLVVAAHPDDEVLGAGGTMARLAQEGQTVTTLILGEGITSRNLLESEAAVALTELHKRCQMAGRILGAAETAVRSLPDNRFDTVPLLDVTQIIEAEIDRVAPETVFVQHGGDLNIDHTITFRAVMTATRPMAHCPVKRLYGYEVGSSTEWAFGQFDPVFRPVVYFEIKATLEAKIQAMAVYESEARDWPHPRSAQALRNQAAQRGSQVGMDAAEAFTLIREIR